MRRFLGIGRRTAIQPPPFGLVVLTDGVGFGSNPRLVRQRTEQILQPVAHGGVRLRPDVTTEQMDAFVAVQLLRFEAVRVALDDSTATARIPRTS